MTAANNTLMYGAPILEKSHFPDPFIGRWCDLARINSHSRGRKGSVYFTLGGSFCNKNYMVTLRRATFGTIFLFHPGLTPATGNFQEVFDKAIIQDKSRELLAVENLTLESDALNIIRLCKDLLSITRSLRESWCLDTMKVRPEGGDSRASDEDVQRVFEEFNRLTEKISALEKS